MTKDTTSDELTTRKYHSTTCAKYEILRGLYPNDKRLTGKDCDCGFEALIKQHELDVRERLLEEIISKGKSTFARKKERGDLKYIKVETIKTLIPDVELLELKAEREAL